MGSRSVASLLPSPSMYVPRSVLMRPMALSRFVSSKSSSVSERSLPRSPRKASSVRGRRPSPSAKFWRRSWSRACAAFALASSVARRRPANSARTASTLTVTPASMRAVRPILRARSTRPRALLGGALGDEGGQAGVDEGQALDDDTVALDRHAGGAVAGGRRRADRRQAGGRRARNGRSTGGGGEADDVGGGVHAPNFRGGLCQLACHDVGVASAPGRPSARISLGRRLDSSPSYSASTARM